MILKSEQNVIASNQTDTESLMEELKDNHKKVMSIEISLLRENTPSPETKQGGV